MSIRIFETRFLACLFFVLSLVFVGMFLLNDSLPDDLGALPSENASASLNVREVWITVAGECGVPEPDIERVALILDKGDENQRSPRPQAKKQTNTDIRPALRAYLQESAHLWNDSQSKTVFPSLVAWILREHLRHEKGPETAVRMAQDQFHILVDFLVAETENSLEEGLGERAVRFKREIDQGLVQLRRVLMNEHRRLQADPLFPCFKELLSPEVFDSLIEHRIRGEIEDMCGTVFREPTRMMVLKEELYSSRLKNAFDEFPGLVLFYVMMDEVKLKFQAEFEMRKISYVGRLGTLESGWPVRLSIKAN